jgi:hypothetical protein
MITKNQFVFRDSTVTHDTTIVGQATNFGLLPDQNLSLQKPLT